MRYQTLLANILAAVQLPKFKETFGEHFCEFLMVVVLLLFLFNSLESNKLQNLRTSQWV
jgi:hypothetical protein